MGALDKQVCLISVFTYLGMIFFVKSLVKFAFKWLAATAARQVQYLMPQTPELI